jgi:hypothetical protein
LGYIESGSSLKRVRITEESQSMRVTIFPRDVVGSYSASVTTTAAFSSGLAADSVLCTFKNSGTNTIVLRELSLGLQVTTGYTKGGVRLGCFFVRDSFTQGTTGGTLVTLDNGNTKKRTTLATTTATIVVSGANGITGDTAADEDTLPLAVGLFDLINAVGTRPFNGLFQIIHINMAEFPIVLAPGEGLRIKNITAFPATGASFLQAEFDYDEVPTY